MSDDENLFMDDPEPSDFVSSRSRLESESQIMGNENGGSFDIKRQESANSQSGIKQSRIHVDLKFLNNKLVIPEPLSQESYQFPVNQGQIPTNIEANNEFNIQQISQDSLQINSVVIDPMKHIKAQFPIRYFIFKNVKANYLKLCKDYGICLTPKANEDKLKFAFNV